jgi:hypothetical protein
LEIGRVRDLADGASSYGGSVMSDRDVAVIPEHDRDEDCCEPPAADYLGRALIVALALLGILVLAWMLVGGDGATIPAGG